MCVRKKQDKREGEFYSRHLDSLTRRIDELQRYFDKVNAVE